MSVGLINPEVADIGGRIVKALNEGGAAGWSTIIGRNVSYALVGVDYGQPGEILRPEDRGEAIITTVDWSGDTAGRLYLVVPSRGAREVVAYMMALMMGGDPNPDTVGMTADDMDAYSEAVAGFFGQGIQQVRDSMRWTARVAVGESILVNLMGADVSRLFGREEYLAHRTKVTIEGCPPFTMLTLVSRSITGVPPEVDGPADAEKLEAAKKLGIEPVNLGIAMKIMLPVVVTIAAKKMRMELIQDMNPGTILEFKKMSGENLDVLAGNIKIATAEAVLINQCFGVQIRNIVDPQAAKE